VQRLGVPLEDAQSTVTLLRAAMPGEAAA